MRYTNKRHFSDRSEERIYRNKIRRQKELRQHIIIGVLSVLLICFMVFFFANTKSEASQKSDQILYKHFTSIQIEPGDTLYSIAEQYVTESKNTVNSFIKEVIFINNIQDPDFLIAGTSIVVPYYATVSND